MRVPKPATPRGAAARATPALRMGMVVLIFLALVLLLWARMLQLTLLDQKFLRQQGDQRASHLENVAASRGIIRDRLGNPLAVSSPVVSLWVNPRQLSANSDDMLEVAAQLHLDAREWQSRLQHNAGREFMYVQRDMDPSQAHALLDQEVPGLYGQSEYQRFYPEGEPYAQVIGFTNIDDRGSDGLELAYEHSLSGRPGERRVLTDLKGRQIRDVAMLKAAVDGHDLDLSLDSRAQFLLYRDLAAQVMAQGARSGMAVALDVQTGEVLAMVSVPSYNPNNRAHLTMEQLRNRVLTDSFEPGSTMKPFTIAAALESGRFNPHSMFDTRPGSMMVGNHVIHDDADNGVIDMTGILTKSSNIGASQIALALPPETLPAMFRRLGFGATTQSGFPGESSGRLPSSRLWKPIGLAHMAFGYGESVTLLQLARAYAAIADGGILHPVTFLLQRGPVPGVRVLDAHLCSQIISMLETVVEPGGTATQAQVPGYLVAGKTGTVHKVVNGSYSSDQYRGLFVGMAPASAPRVVLAVMIDTPTQGKYFGGQVAAPVFAQAMGEILRLLDVAPDHSAEHLADRSQRRGGAG